MQVIITIQILRVQPTHCQSEGTTSYTLQSSTIHTKPLFHKAQKTLGFIHQ